MNVLIIDDQINVIEGIKKGIDWNALGIGQVFEASNITDAEKILEGEQISVMICDIEMPMGNGTELLRRVRQKGIPVECIFLTAYAKFEYASEAIKLNAFDYVLQPIKYEELKAVLVNALDKIRQDARRKSLSDAGMFYRENNQVYAGSILKGILDGNRELIACYLEDEFIRKSGIKKDSTYCPVYISVLRIENYEIASSGGSLLSRLKGLMTAVYPPSWGEKMLIATSAGKYVMLFLAGKRMETDQSDSQRTEEGQGRAIALKTEEFIEKCRQEGLVTACYMGEVCTIDFLPEEYQRLKDMDGENVGAYSHLFFRDNAGVQEEQPGLNWERYSVLMKGRHYGIVRSELEMYLRHQLEEHKITHSMLFSFVQSFVMFAHGMKDEIGVRSQLLLRDPSGYEKYSAADRSVENTIEFVSYVLDCLQADNGADGEERSVVDRVKHYIDLNIERDINRNDIARYIYMNPEYLSKLFKKETGTGLAEYIVAEKMKRAKSYLTSTQLPVSVIAGKLGYSNFSFFAKTFKKSTGLLPNDYRKENSK